MPTQLVIVADTHLPKRAKVLPEALWEAVEAADIVLHAGDWMDEATLDAFEARSRRLVGVPGNNDGPELHARLSEVASLEIEGQRWAMIHETGAKQGREQRMASAFPDVDVLVFGHSHIPWDSTAPNGMRLLNPGSPTDRRRQPVCTFMTAEVDGREIRDVTLVPVPR